MPISDKSDQEMIEERKNKLMNDEEAGLQVEVPLREQIPAKLASTLREMDLPRSVAEVWQRGNADRAEYLGRIAEYTVQVDELIDPIYDASMEWSSTLHLPVILSVAKTFHARFNAALLSQDPPFAVVPRKASGVERAQMIEDLMRYTVKDWSNWNQGIEGVVDKWIWDWCVQGQGVLKNRWAREFTRFVDVDEVQIQTVELVEDPETGEMITVPSMRIEEVEVQKTIKKYEGPIIEQIELEDFLVIGGKGDPQNADYVFQRSYMTSDALLSLADQKVFDEDAVEEIIRSGKDYKNKDIGGLIKQDREYRSGVAGATQDLEHSRFEILEVYTKADVDGSGIGAEVIMWVHPQTGELLRATYLHRVMPTGLRPFHVAEFHRKAGDQYPIGLAELLYSLNKEIDALNNMNIDIGILTSMPFGFYRPSASMEQEVMPIEPGALVPLDNPATDVVFPNLGNRVSFGFNEISSLMSWVERLTSTSDLTLGVMSGTQGPTRSATGVRALMGESSQNLDIYLKRLNRPWKRMLTYLFHQLQQKMEPGFEFRVTGSDGQKYFRSIESKDELQGMYDFELDSNSANSNKAVQYDVASQLYQMTSNPIDLQLGLVTPSERYEAIRNMLQVMGVKEISKYLRKPEAAPRKYSPIEVLDYVLAGVPIQLDPTQDLDGVIAILTEFLKDDLLVGQFSEQHAMAVQAKLIEAQQMKQALQQAQAQAANIQQQQMNMQQGAGPGLGGIVGNVNINEIAGGE